MLLSCYQNVYVEAGCDEAGRGPLAGPVFAAAVVLPCDYINTKLNDSKKINLNLRLKLRKEIEQEAIDYAVASIDNHEIDKINILKASIKCMHLALSKLKVSPQFIIVDGNKFEKYKQIEHKCIVKGDAKYLSIAAASILAKTYRDDYMIQLHEQFPQYLWANNKGYPTKAHFEAIEKYGITEYHRLSFCKQNDNQLKFIF